MHFLLFFLWASTFLFGPQAVSAPWEVGVIFLGADETDEYQKDIDQNILELARLKPHDQFKLRIYREWENRAVTYDPNPVSHFLSPWDPLFFQVPWPGILMSGELRLHQKTSTDPKNIFHNPTAFQNFLNGIYVKPESKRALLISGHGLAYNGLKAIKLKHFRKVLESTLPARLGKPLDVLWLDACFMATVEVAYELRSAASYLLASEEAEFSAGAPFQSLKNLEAAPDSVLDTALEWGEDFIESYSYLQKGSQRRSVYKSAATISVISLDRITSLVENISDLTRTFGGEMSSELRKSLQKSNGKRKTELEELVDAGSFFLTLTKNKFTPQDVKPKIEPILSQLEFLKPERRNSNPKVTIPILTEKSLLVFGFEDWVRGHADDPETLDRLPPDLIPREFYPGPEGKQWPYIEISKKSFPASIAIFPFSVGLQKFNYFLVNPQTQQIQGGFEIIARTQDLFNSKATHPENPILFTGYTQSIGRASERYSGLGILDPSLQAINLEYLRLEFSEKTGWGGL